MFFALPPAAPRRKLLKEQYELTNNVLGSGTYGKVQLAYDRKNNRKCAIKIISKGYIKKYNAEKHVKNEISFLQILHHQNIVKYYENFEDTENIYIVMEHCDQGTLYSYVKKKGKLTEEEAFPCIHQIALALQYLHSKNFIHRDIKADNILLSDNKIKLCDFNWSISLTQDKVKPCLCGTTEYMPPEVVKMQPQDAGVDVWSLGILAHFLVHGELLFKAKDRQHELVEKICDERNIKFSEHLSPSFRFLLTQMLSHNKRININQVLSSPWMRSMLSKRSGVSTTTLTPVKGRSSAYEQNRFSCGSLSTNHSFSTSIKFKRPLQPIKVQTPALNSNISAFRVEKKQ